MVQWLEGNHSTTLLYSATRDGFSAASFHRCCDNQGETLTVAQSTQNYIFGGYATQSWGSQIGYKTAPGCWIFTLSNPTNVPAKFRCINDTDAMVDAPHYGPTFGRGHDIHISDASNTNKASYFDFHTYEDSSQLGSKVFTGSNKFQTNEIEVYLVQ